MQFLVSGNLIIEKQSSGTSVSFSLGALQAVSRSCTEHTLGKKAMTAMLIFEVTFFFF